MFRDMLRKKQELSREECVDILKAEKRGVLSVIGDGGYPYAFPIDHLYGEDGHIYFHCGKSGHKLDALAACDKVCYCVYDGGYCPEGEWALYVRSVIVFGRARLVEDHQKCIEISRDLSYKFTRDSEYIETEIARSGGGVACIELIPEHMTGKRVHEA